MLESFISPVFVGRTREMEFLEQALRAAQNGAGRCVLLAGEAGIGKSRLAGELVQRAAVEHFIILQGHCSEQDASFPYAPWIDAWRTFLAPKSASEASEFLGAFASELVKFLPELSLLIPSIQPSPPLDPEAEKHRVFESLARFGASLAATRPLLIILEDLHWSDEQSLELLHFFIRRIAALPILLIGTLRTEELSPRLTHHLAKLNRDRLLTEIQLTPLVRQDVAQMAQAILHTEHPIADDWLDTFMPLTEGNPFFIEEILKSLPEGSAFDKLQIPRSIQDVVQRRIEGLPEKTRYILLFAAIIGERFDFGLLQETAAQDEPSLLRMLKELLAALLIVEETAEQFAFRHALTREAVLATLMLRERRAMHQAVGEAMERLVGTRSKARAEQLGYHFYQAGAWQKAMDYSQRAGEQAQALYAPHEALTHFTRALDAARQLGISPPHSCVRGRAQMYEMLGEFDSARADYEVALESTRREADRKGEWQSLIDLGFLWQSRDLVHAGKYFELAFDLARSLEENTLLAQSLNRIGYWHAHRGQIREARSDHQQALELFRQLNDRRGMAETLELLGLDSYALGEVIQGAVYCEQAVPILRELDDRQGLVNTLTNLSSRPRYDSEVMGEIDLHQLANLSETALGIARSCDYRVGEVAALHEGAACLCRAGEYGRGWEYLGRALSIAEEIEHRELLTSVHLVWGIELYLGLLALDEAREHLEAALATAQERGSVGLTFVATAGLVRACIAQNDLARAQGLLDAVLEGDLPDVKGMTLLQRTCWTARAELELALRNPARALEIVDRLLASMANLAQYGPQAVPRLSQLRGQAFVALGRIGEAIAEFRGAQTVTQKQGQRSMVWRLHIDLGKAYLVIGRREDAEQEFSSAQAIIQQLADTVPDGELHEHFLKQALAEIPTAPALTPRQAAMKEFGGLTERERQVAVLIAQGKSNREIAETLAIAVRTVESHITRILDRLGLKSRAEIAMWAVGKGLARPPG